MSTIAADTAAAIRRQRKRSGKTDTGPADDAAARRGHLNTRIGFGASETWSAWEFADGSRLLMNHQTGRTWVPVAPRHRDLADGALRRGIATTTIPSFKRGPNDQQDQIPGDIRPD